VAATRATTEGKQRARVGSLAQHFVHPFVAYPPLVAIQVERMDERRAREDRGGRRAADRAASARREPADAGDDLQQMVQLVLGAQREALLRMRSDGETLQRDAVVWLRLVRRSEAIPRRSQMRREEATERIVEAKREKGPTFSQLAQKVGRPWVRTARLADSRELLFAPLRTQVQF
jgi:hypothetical protein